MPNEKLSGIDSSNYPTGQQAKQRKLFRLLSVASVAVAIISIAIGLLIPSPKGCRPGKELIVGEY